MHVQSTFFYIFLLGTLIVLSYWDMDYREMKKKSSDKGLLGLYGPSLQVVANSWVGQ